MDRANYEIEGQAFEIFVGGSPVLPALFMTLVVVTYIFFAPEGFGLPMAGQQAYNVCLTMPGEIYCGSPKCDGGESP